MENKFNFTLSKQQEMEIQNIIIEQLNKVLQPLIESILPTIIAKITLPQPVNLQQQISLGESFNEDQKNELINKNRTKWNYMLDKREKVFYQHHRIEKILELYHDCLEKEPTYIPRKFRQSKIHVKSDEEFKVIENLELQRFNAECELLRIRKDNLTNDLSTIDKEIEKTISSCSTNIRLQSALLNNASEFIKKDISQVKEKWIKKIGSLKKAFQIDEQKNLMSNRKASKRTESTSITEHEESINKQLFIPETQLEVVPETPQQTIQEIETDTTTETQSENDTETRQHILLQPNESNTVNTITPTQQDNIICISPHRNTQPKDDSKNLQPPPQTTKRKRSTRLL